MEESMVGVIMEVPWKTGSPKQWRQEQVLLRLTEEICGAVENQEFRSPNGTSIRFWRLLSARHSIIASPPSCKASTLSPASCGTTPTNPVLTAGCPVDVVSGVDMRSTGSNPPTEEANLESGTLTAGASGGSPGYPFTASAYSPSPPTPAPSEAGGRYDKSPITPTNQSQTSEFRMGKEILEEIVDIIFEVIEQKVENNILLRFVVSKCHALVLKYLPLIFSTLQAKGIAK